MVTITLNEDQLRAAAKRLNEELGPAAVTQALAAAVGRTRPFAIDTAAQQVSALYNISEGEVKSSNTHGNAVDVGIKLGSDSGAVAEITFMGRVLTYDHFTFSPSSPPKGKYTVFGEVYRGEPKALGGSNVFVPRGGITQIPFQRVGRRTEIEAIHTVSIPQMISNERLEEPISEAINERLFDEFVQQFEKS